MFVSYLFTVLLPIVVLPCNQATVTSTVSHSFCSHIWPSPVDLVEATVTPILITNIASNSNGKLHTIDD